MPRTKYPASKQTKVKIKKGFHNAPITYEVLMNQQFNAEDIKIIEKGLAVATTPAQVDKHLIKPLERKCPWRLVMISLIGNYDIRYLSYKGLEVAVFVKRQTSKVTPEPEDPVPEGVLEHPDDVWVRVDLFVKSPRQLLKAVQEQLQDRDLKLAASEAQLISQKRVIEAQERQIKSLQTQLLNLQQPSAKIKKKK